MFSKNIRILYLYIVSFVALMTIILGITSVVENITRYAFPTEYNYSNEVSSERVYNLQIRTLRDIFTAGAVVLVSAPLYLYHWKMIQKERKSEE